MSRVKAILSAVSLMLALPVLCYFARNTGPAARVVFFDYFPVIDFAFYLLAAALGAAVGFQAARAEPSAKVRWVLCALGFVLIALWALQPQLQAFPADSGIAERDAWARRHVRYYPELTRVIATLPEIQRDIGHVFAIAPTAHDEHRFAREMNGDDMLFSFEVKGARGAGTFRVSCTLDDYRIYDWRDAKWLYDGKEQLISSVPTQVPRR